MPYWRMKDGEHILISDMATSHIINSMAILNRQKLKALIAREDFSLRLEQTLVLLQEEIDNRVSLYDPIPTNTINLFGD